MGWPQVQFGSKFLKYIFHKSSDCLAIRVGNRNSDNISCLLTNINFSYGQKLHDSQIILQKFWSELWSDNRHVFNSYFISQYVRFVILCALYVSERLFSLVFFLKKCINTRIYGHLRRPFFSPFRYGKVLELVRFCKSLNNLEGMTIFGKNDNNPEGMTVIRKERQ